MDTMEDLETDYYELAKSPVLAMPDQPKEEPETLVNKTSGPVSMDFKERFNWMERRIDELEKTLVLVSKNFDDYRKGINEKLDKIERHGKTPEGVEDELSSLISLVRKVSSINEEIKTKTPQMLRELESRMDKFVDKIGIFDQELKKVKEEKKDDDMMPVILE